MELVASLSVLDLKIRANQFQVTSLLDAVFLLVGIVSPFIYFFEVSLTYTSFALAMVFAEYLDHASTRCFAFPQTRSLSVSMIDYYIQELSLMPWFFD